jgi:hypothetical protein
VPADYIYSSRKGDDVYHVFVLCPKVDLIKKKHKQYGKPPENRRLCEICEQEMRDLLAL